MESFNIKVPYHGEEITFTISHHKNEFKLIYNGGVIGALGKAGDDWRWLKDEEISIADLPPLEYKKGINDEELKLGLPDINHVVGAIENHLSGN
jgi:hypothetical protein